MKHNKRFKLSLVASTVILSTNIAATASAAELNQAKKSEPTLEKIIVTSQKRVQNLQDVPVSVAVLNSDDLKEMGLTDLDSLSTHIPNVNIETTHNPSITIRGIGSGDNEAFEQSVGMYIDGIYMGRYSQYKNTLFDIERVEVLRGPQGILFGKNTIAGAISMQSTRPTNDFESSFSYSKGLEFDSNNVQAMVSGGLTDTVSARLALSFEDEESYLYNTRTQRDYASPESKSGRLSLQWDPSENFSVFFKAEASDGDNDGDFRSRIFTAPDSVVAQYKSFDPLFDENNVGTTSKTGVDRTNRNLGYFDKLDTESYALETTYEFDNGGLLTTVTGQTSYDREHSFDPDFQPVDFLYRLRDQSFDQFSQEIRYASPIGDSVEYLFGVFYQTADLDSSAGTDIYAFLPPSRYDYDYTQTTDTYAAFGQVRYILDDMNSFDFGLRYTKEDKEARHVQWFSEVDAPNGPLNAQVAGVIRFLGFDEHDINDERSKSGLTWSLKYQHQLDEDIMVYSSVATGFKSGGFNEGIEEIVVDKPFEYDDEEAIAYELGIKSTLLDGAMRFNAAIYHTSIENLQLAQLVGSSFVVANAGEIISKGVEIDVQWQSTDNLFVSFSAAYNNARYEDFANAACTAENSAAVPQGQSCTQDLTGEQVQHAPDWTAALGLRHDTYTGDDIEIKTHLNWTFKDRHSLTQDNDPIDSQGAFAKTDVGVSLLYLPYELEFDLLVTNVFDKQTRNGSDDVTFTGAPFAPIGIHYEFVGEPRQVMLRITKEIF